jgi:hypothetical protein
MLLLLSSRLNLRRSLLCSVVSSLGPFVEVIISLADLGSLGEVKNEFDIGPLDIPTVILLSADDG